MKREELLFSRPSDLEAHEPPERRGTARDNVRLLVSDRDGHHHHRFGDLVELLRAGDLLVVNRSATLPASLPAEGAPGQLLLNLAVRFGHGLWLAEPRWSASEPGPLPLSPGSEIRVGSMSTRLVAPHPGLPRLWFVQAHGDLSQAMAAWGRPIRYGYLHAEVPLSEYQTVFGDTPGSAEMPSAGRPFTPDLVRRLRSRGVEIAGLVLHTAVSSQEVMSETVEAQALLPEPYDVPEATALAVNRARAEGRRVIAVGTTVVRALESAWSEGRVHGHRGVTRLMIHPARGLHVVDALLTGFHDPATSHLAMLHSVAGARRVAEAYDEAIREGYLWHEFGDSHLLWAR